MSNGSEPRTQAGENTLPGTAAGTVRVLLPLPLADAYDYGVPQGFLAEPGRFVIVPLGKREVLGVVWGPGTGEVPPEKIRNILEILPALPMASSPPRSTGSRRRQASTSAPSPPRRSACRSSPRSSAIAGAAGASL